MTTKEDLQEIKFGQRVAEEETKNLSEYFVETDDWRRVFNGEIDVIYGTKGAGKSAIYTILDDNVEDLFDKSILLTVAENPRGDTVFEGLSIDPPTSEAEFIRLWKLYFIVIAHSQLENWGIKNKYSDELKVILGDSGLIPPQHGLKAILKVCFDYVRKIIQIESYQQGIDLNEATGMPSGINFKVTFREPNKNELKAGVKSIGYLLELLDNALKESGFTLWVAIDRLDVAFTENLELETNALRALFKVYRDLTPLNNLKIKIFLRDDIWKRLTEEGFREASHITKTLTIVWSKETIVNLIIRRLLNNESFVAKYGLNKSDILSEYKKQEQLFYRFFPEQIEVGDKKPKTIEWILGRLQDGKRVIAPREIIHLFNEAKQEQIKRIEIGQDDLENDNLIGRNAFKIALDTVSKVRLEQTIYAEYPSLKPFIQKLESKKTEQRIETLAEIWSLSENEAGEYAKKLVDIGFFEKRGDSQNTKYWVPFIYRNELKMSQGAAE
jgi:hypothetical protein